MPFNFSRLQTYQSLSRIVTALLEVWPEHEDYCEARFSDDPPGYMQRSDELAGLVLRLAEGSDIGVYCSDYKWMCEEFLKEELYFRRHGTYRLTTFQQAFDEVYNKTEYMARYVRGILISQLIWTPHARAFDLFRTRFLPVNPAGSRHLEVGPGHGLFLYFASQSDKLAELEAWDVSKSSIAATTAALQRLGVSRPIKLIEQDVLSATPHRDMFDSAIISEVLEHLERPDLAMKTLRTSLRPGGRLFINVPVNSPAPDHIYLWTNPDEFVAWVEAQGFEIEAAEFYPVTGASLQRAIAKKLSISCVVIARRPLNG